MSLEGDAPDYEQGGRIQGGQGDAFSSSKGVRGFVAEGIHGLHGLGLPIGDDIAFVLVQAEVRANIDVEVVLVAFVAEKGVGLRQRFRAHIILEPFHLPLLGGKPPGVEVEVERVVVHDVLLQPGDATVGCHRLDAREPGIVTPLPDTGRHDVGQHAGVHQLGKDEHFHVGERHRRGLALQIAPVQIAKLRGQRLHGVILAVTRDIGMRRDGRAGACFPASASLLSSAADTQARRSGRCRGSRGGKAFLAMERLKYHDILYSDAQLGPYPEHLLKRVAKPTNEIPGPVARRSMKESVFIRSFFGEYGEEIQENFKRMTVRYPLGAALVDLQWFVNKYKDKRPPMAAKKAPIPDDPRVMSRHLKSLGYFLGADLMGIGRLPQSAVYSSDVRGKPDRGPLQVRHRVRGPQERTDAHGLQRLGRHSRPGQLPDLPAPAHADRGGGQLHAALGHRRGADQHEQLLDSHAPSEYWRRDWGRCRGWASSSTLSWGPTSRQPPFSRTWSWR